MTQHKFVEFVASTVLKLNTIENYLGLAEVEIKILKLQKVTFGFLAFTG